MKVPDIAEVCDKIRYPDIESDGVDPEIEVGDGYNMVTPARDSDGNEQRTLRGRVVRRPAYLNDYE